MELNKQTLTAFAAGALVGAYLSLSSNGSTPNAAAETASSTATPSPPRRSIPRPTQNVIMARSVTIPQLVTRAETCFPSVIATIALTGEKQTYAQFSARVRRLGAKLQASISPGDRVAVLSLNCPEYLQVLYGVAWAGGIVVPLNTRLACGELVDVLKDCEAKMLFFDEAFAQAAADLAKLAPSLQTLVQFGPKYESFLPPSPSAEPTSVEAESVYGLFYTGGTTGKCKGVMLCHQGLVINAYAICTAANYRQGCRYLHAGPMFHLADGASTFGVTMAGGTHVFIPRFTPDATLQAFQNHKVTHTLLVPTMFQMLLQQPDLQSYDRRSIRCFIYGASPMPEVTLLAAMQAFPGAKFVQGYGMTEASPCITFLGAEHHYAGSPLMLSVGQVVPHGDLRIVDEQDRPVPPGVVGEICIRGPQLMLGYWNRPETTELAMRGGWFHTGDGGKMDANGFVFIVDRIKDMIVSGGENVYSNEVEQCVLQVSGVLAVAVVGAPDPVLVEKVVAICVVKEGNPQRVTEDDVVKHCKANIAGYKCPKLVVLRHEPLPLSGAGKVLKSELRKPFWEGHQLHIYSNNDARKSTYDAVKGR